MKRPSFLRPRVALCGAIALGSLALSACTTRSEPVAIRSPGIMERLTPYRVQIQQGNVVTREQVALVKPGMPREQVRDLLGSPMLTDLFHDDRWDYLYAVGRGGNISGTNRLSVTVFFKNDSVDRVAAPDLPTENEFVARMAGPAPDTKNLPTLELSAEQRARLPAPVKGESVALPQPQGAQRNYPPLESR